jgi:hypothetical protein
MKWVSLVAWVATAGVGIAMAALWLERGGLRQAGLPHSVHARRLGAHVGFAVSGLLIYVIYLVTDSDATVWIAFAVLVVVGFLGSTAFRIWQRRRLGFVKATHDDWNWPPEAMAKSDAVPAEQHLPASVVLLHGVLAIATVVLVLLTALGVGESEESTAAAAPRPAAPRPTALTLGPASTVVRVNRLSGPRKGQRYRSQLTLGGVYHVYENGPRVFVANSSIVPSQEGGATRADVERLQRWALHVRRARGQTPTPSPAVRAAARRFSTGQ